MKKIIHFLLISIFSFISFHVSHLQFCLLALQEEERHIGIRMTLAISMMNFQKSLMKLKRLTHRSNKQQILLFLKKHHLPVPFLFLLVEKELSLPHRMEPNGLKGLLDQRVNSEQSPTVMIPWLWLVFPEPSSPHRMEPNGLKENQELKHILGMSHTQTIHSWQLVMVDPSSLPQMEPNGRKGNLEQKHLSME